MCKMIHVDSFLIAEKEYLALIALLEKALNESQNQELETLYWTLLDMIELNKDDRYALQET